MKTLCGTLRLCVFAVKPLTLSRKSRFQYENSLRNFAPLRLRDEAFDFEPQIKIPI
jgi:hypothetical protein